MTTPNQNRAVAVRPSDTIKGLLNSDQFKLEVARVLPKTITPDRLIRVALTACLKTPALYDCTRESLFDSILRCAQAGLEPDGRLAHLIPYGKVCQVIFDWKGLVALALRNDYTVYPDMVCRKDKFRAWIEDGVKRLVHEVDWTQSRGEPMLFYCTAIKNGVLDYEIMTVEECDAIRERSRAKSGPWVTDTNEMRKKCPIRRMSKRWDLKAEIRDVINADDDTPSFDPEIKISQPIFKEKQANAEEVKPDEEPQEDSFEAAEPFDPTAQLRSQIAAAGFTEEKFMNGLKEIGVIREAMTLQALALDPPALDAAEKGASDLIAMMKKTKK